MPVIGPPLDFHKQKAVQVVTDAIGAVRLSRATDGPFQSIAYQRKREEAAQYLSTVPAPSDLSGFPLLAGITVLRGMSAFDLATLWLTTNNDHWTPFLDETEVLRDGAMFAIKSASTRAEIDAAVATFQSDLTALSTSGGTT